MRTGGFRRPIEPCDASSAIAASHARRFRNVNRRSIGRVVPIVLLLCCGLPAAQSQPQPQSTSAAPVIPDTPAGHTFRAWLDALNSGDTAQMKAYAAKYDPARPADQMIFSSKQTGGMKLLGIDKSQRLHLEFRVKEKASPTTAVEKLDVKGTDPAEVVTFGLRAVPPGMTAADMTVKVDAAIRSRVIDGIAAKPTEFYIYPETAKKMWRRCARDRKRANTTPSRTATPLPPYSASSYGR
jgi:hypothetical protein